MKRRQALALGGAVAVGAGALGWALSPKTTPPTGSDAAGADVWDLRFDAPDGGTVSLAAFKGRPLLLNFWATWCPPCVEEMPLLDRFQATYGGSGWQVVGVAVDNLAPVRDFLGRRPVAFPIGLAGMTGVVLARNLGNAGGALPFSVIYDRQGAAVERKLGAWDWQELSARGSRER